MKLRYLGKCIGKIILMVALLLQVAEAKVEWLSLDKLVALSDHIVIAQVQSVSVAKTDAEREFSILKNKLMIIESLKGVWSVEKPLVLKTVKFSNRAKYWVEDSVHLPSVGLKVLLFLTKNKKAEWIPVNRIQGVWFMMGDEAIGSGSSVDEVREVVQKQTNNEKLEKENILRTGETKTSRSYIRNNKGDVFDGGHWASAQGGSAWIERSFYTSQFVTAVYIGRASTDITTKGFKLVLKLKKPNGEWITVDELHDTNINRTALSGGAIGKSIPSYTKRLSPAIKVMAFRLEFYGNGWFDATDIRIYAQEQTKEIVQDSCSSKAFRDLLDTAEIQTQTGHYKEALEAYRKAYRICPMKDLEEMMAWLMGEVGDE